jgi:lysophospholipase L1-like esterase
MYVMNMVFGGAYEDPSTLDILVMGGSTTNEKYIDEGQTWVDVLRDSFAAEGPPINIANAAIDGHSTFGHIWSFDIWFSLIRNLQSRYIVAYIGINDVEVGHAKRYDTTWSSSWQRRLRYYRVNNSAIYHVYRTIRGNIRARNAHLVHGDGNNFDVKWDEPSSQPDIEASRESIKENLKGYADMIRIFSEKIRNFNAEPICITQPRGDYQIKNGEVLGKVVSGSNVNIGDYVKIMLFNRELMETCAEVKAICIDLADGFSFANGDVYDDLHTTPQGSKKIGKAIYKLLKHKIE